MSHFHISIRFEIFFLLFVLYLLYSISLVNFDLGLLPLTLKGKGQLVHVVGDLFTHYDVAVFYY